MLIAYLNRMRKQSHQYYYLLCRVAFFLTLTIIFLILDHIIRHQFIVVESSPGPTRWLQ